MQLELFENILGLELQILSDQLYKCNYVILSQHKKQLQLTEKGFSEGTLPTILQKIPKKFPVALSISGKGIIHKSIILKENANLNYIKEAFPSVEEKEFYIQETLIDNHLTMSIARCGLVDDIVGIFLRAGLNILNLTFGGLAVSNIHELLSFSNGDNPIDRHIFTYTENQQFAGYRYQSGEVVNKAYTLAGTEMPENDVVAYANAFQLFLYNRLIKINVPHSEIDRALENFIEQWKIKKIGIFYLGGLFAALLISFLLFSHYNAENARLSESAGNIASNTEELDLFKKNIAENENILKRFNWNGGYNYGLLIDQIGRTMPRQIRLKRLLFNDFKNPKDVETRQPNLSIQGETSNLAAVNNWIFLLKEKKWIKSVELVSYEEDSQSDFYVFNISIKY
ncbi:PilN domain-containing protein [Pedobacter sp. AW1-32]|uniref:PilN domain-containing protein n=1 Tax=Pedobacter sp. AW1-32 TaxID=3383026 RepID=UPI003FF07C0F